MTRALFVGLATIVVANTVALTGASRNRSGEPESTLQLTDRELKVPYYNAGIDGDDSGLALRLDWRVLTHAPGDSSEARTVDFQAFSAYWLDSTKLASLGFDVRHFAARSDAEAFYAGQRPRLALIVLEMDGASHRAAVDRVRLLAARAEAARAANPR